MTQSSQPINFAGEFRSGRDLWIGNTISATGDIHFHSSDPSNDEIDRACLQALRCPDPLAIKNRLKENKDKLLRKSFDWILQDKQYISWHSGRDVGLLWIKGAAGQGKTMMSIGLIEVLSQQPNDKAAVTYFFCQNADYELNTIEAIIKGLIFQLMIQQESVRRSLRNRWNASQNRFTGDVSSWRGLWSIFIEMLHNCNQRRVYVVVDALDECKGDGMADLLKLIVRTGLDRPSQIKWLLTSRPLDSAERELLAAPDQLGISLDLHLNQISQAIRTYVSHKVAELDRRCGYSPGLRQELEEHLSLKAEDTFLWVALVCKRLETIDPAEALATVDDLPPDLGGLYRLAYRDLSQDMSSMNQDCISLLKTMMLAYRPLSVHEIGGLAVRSGDVHYLDRLIGRSAAFVKTRGVYVEFVHQSARDYLAGSIDPSPFGTYLQTGHYEVATRCLERLSQQLKFNFVASSRDNATPQELDKNQNKLLASLEYAALFWSQHLRSIKDVAMVQKMLLKDGVVEHFLKRHFLEWLEYCGWLKRIPSAMDMLQNLEDFLIELQYIQLNPLLPATVRDANRFLLRHHSTISKQPLHSYSSAMVFTPSKSIVRRHNIHRIPHWITQTPVLEEDWPFLIQNFNVGDFGLTMLMSHDEKHTVAESDRDTVVVRNLNTGAIERELKYRRPSTMKISPDGQFIAFGSPDGPVEIWDLDQGSKLRTLTGHQGRVIAMASSLDGWRVATICDGVTVKIWNTSTSDVQVISLVDLVKGEHWRIVAFSRDGHHIAIGADKAFKKPEVKHLSRDENAKVLFICDTDSIRTLAFSPDAQRVIWGTEDGFIKAWNVSTGGIEKSLMAKSGYVSAVGFSSDGERIVLGLSDATIKIWNSVSGETEKKLVGSVGGANLVMFYQGDRRILSTSHGDINIWDVSTDTKDPITDVNFTVTWEVKFWDKGRRAVTLYRGHTAQLWNAGTGQLEKELIGYLPNRGRPAISPIGRHIAVETQNEAAEIRDTYTDEKKMILTGGVLSMAFSPDGQQLLTATRDKVIRLWNTNTGKKVKDFVGHSDYTDYMAMSLDGQYFFSKSSDLTARVWDVRSGENYILLKDSMWDRPVATFSPDGRRIAAGPGRGDIIVWDLYLSSKTTNWLDRLTGIFLKARQCLNIEVGHIVGRRIRFSQDGARIITPHGEFSIDDANHGLGRQMGTLPEFFVHHGWIHIGAKPVLKLPPGMYQPVFDTFGDQLVIASDTGRPLFFQFDRQKFV